MSNMLQQEANNAKTIRPTFAKFFSVADTIVSGSIRISVSSVLSQGDFSGSSSPDRVFVWIPLRSKPS